jgi:hypothetical protein
LAQDEEILRHDADEGPHADVKREYHEFVINDTGRTAPPAIDHTFNSLSRPRSNFV